MRTWSRQKTKIVTKNSHIITKGLFPLSQAHVILFFDSSSHAENFILILIGKILIDLKFKPFETIRNIASLYF